VLLRDGSAHSAVVLIDWGRARLGSPLEDVSSWLESLGYWEPAVRQQRQTLLRHYLRARGLPVGVGRELDLRYWVAAACNVLAGALHYHLLQASRASEPASHRPVEAVRAVRDDLGAIQRADVLWRQTVLPQVVMIIKGLHVAGVARPAHDREAGVAGAEGFPTCGADAVERAQDLANDAGVGDDQDLFAGMGGGDGGDGAQDAASEVTVALATGPAEPIIGLPQIGVPEAGIASLHLQEWDAFEPTAVNLAQ
jgi:hypothetical protein